MSMSDPLQPANSLEPNQLLAMVAVSCLWGVTNPFISRGTKTARKPSADINPLLKPLLELHYFITNWRFSLPFVLNQSASLLFMVLVVNLPLTLTVVGVNSLTFLVTALTGSAIGEAPLTTRMVLGTFLILCGVLIVSI